VKGEASARPDRDFTIKVAIDSGKLKPQVGYAFQFTSGSEKSPIGHFRLPPGRGAKLDSLKYAVFSCANWKRGYFNAYGAAAREKLDFWMHLGDFIYEDGPEKSADPWGNDVTVKARNDGVQPAREIISLEDYRKRHALYHTDADLQRLSSSAPLIAIWDDHEVANDAWTGGAGAHSGKEGDWEARRAAAMRAYHEWMPTNAHADVWRDDAHEDGKGAPWMKWRRLDFGDLASLLLLETRHTARTNSASMSRGKVAGKIVKLLQAAGNPHPDKWPGSKLEKGFQALQSEVDKDMRRDEKTILGTEQLAWLGEQVQNRTKSGVKWQLVAQPLVVQEKLPPNYEEAIKRAHANGAKDLAEEWSRLLANVTASPESKLWRAAVTNLASGRYKINLSFDDWMGYYADRSRFMAALGTAEPSATLVYGGDSHNGWAGTLRDASGKAVAVEFSGMSVTSPGAEFYPPRFPPKLEAAAWEAANTDMAWADTHNRGFMLVTLGRDKHHVEYRGVEVKTQGKPESKCLSAFGVARGGGPERLDCVDKVSLAEVSGSGHSAQRHGQAGLRRGASSLSVSH